MYTSHPACRATGLVEGALRSASTFQVNVQALRGDISVLTGAGGNIVVLPGRDGKLLIEAGFAGSRPQISSALASISADPVRQLINTHWHFDHTGGNEWLQAEGAAILAHENTRKHLSSATLVEGWDYTFPAVPAGAIPSEVFSDEHTVHVNGATVALKHYLPAHTDADISVHFEEADVFLTGDTWWNGDFPFIDYWTGGSIDGMIRAAEANLAKVTDKMVIVPGHGAVSDKSRLAIYRDLLVEVRDKTAALKKQGKSVEEVIAAKLTARWDDQWGGGFIRPAHFACLVYMGV